MKKITIAIDGHSSCGKSTMAKDLAKEIGYIYIDSGAMYRAVTLYALQNNLIRKGIIDKEALKQELDKINITFELDSKSGLPQTYLNDQLVEDQIRSMEVSNNVSPIATLDFVREAMVKQQQALGKKKGIVMDGRDIGTTVFPEAELKIFVTASAQIRAERRYKELTGKGKEVSFDEILSNVKERDKIDENRSISPLRKAKDAIVLDNSQLSIAEQKAWLIDLYQKTISQNHD